MNIAPLKREIEQLAKDNDDDFLEGLSASERATLVTLLKKVAATNGIHEMPTD